MDAFDKEKVLEQILLDAPTISNRRKLVKGRRGKVMAYAFYNNNGFPDPAFNFHRLNTPVKTTPNSSLCEVYSVFGYNHERFLRAKSRRDNVHQGPHVPDLQNPAEALREDSGLDGIDFFRSADRFAKHFNGICRRFKYVPEMIDLHYDFDKAFAEGTYGILIKQERLDKARIVGARGPKDIIVPLTMNFNTTDPTLYQAIIAVETSYRKGLEQKGKNVILI